MIPSFRLSALIYIQYFWCPLPLLSGLQGQEIELLQALDFVARQLKSVSLHVVAMEPALKVKGMLLFVKKRYFIVQEG